MYFLLLFFYRGAKQSDSWKNNDAKQIIKLLNNKL